MGEVIKWGAMPDGVEAPVSLEGKTEDFPTIKRLELDSSKTGEQTLEGLPDATTYLPSEEHKEEGQFVLGEEGWEITETLATTGAYGKIYKARQLNNDREVALKVARESGEDAFREARIMANLSHHNIVRALNLGVAEESGGRLNPALIMELVEGKTMSDQSYTFRELVEIGTQLADALDYMHSRGVVHGDVKPANIIMNEDGVPIITDLGSAGGDYREGTATNEYMRGTAKFVAPEQNDMEGDISGRADQHALAATLYERFTIAYKLYEKDGVFTSQWAHTSSDQKLTKPEGLPDPIYEVFEKAISLEAEDRYEDCRAFLSALQGVLDEHPEYAELDHEAFEITTKHPDVIRQVREAVPFSG